MHRSHSPACGFHSGGPSTFRTTVEPGSPPYLEQCATAKTHGPRGSHTRNAPTHSSGGQRAKSAGVNRVVPSGDCEEGSVPSLPSLWRGGGHLRHVPLYSPLPLCASLYPNFLSYKDTSYSESKPITMISYKLD